MGQYKFFSTDETRTYPPGRKNRGNYKNYLVVFRYKTKNEWHTYVSEFSMDRDQALSNWRNDGWGLFSPDKFGPGWESKNIDNIHVFEINN
jgi:hypothetical protein